MPFQLTISEGQDSGKAFVFEQPAIVIGRTDECDVVLYDSGVSRQHARIFSEGATYFVEDLGSANGTRVNGQTVKRHELAEGDAVSLGAVVFKFSGKAPPPMLMPTNGGTSITAATGHSTRIVSAEEMSNRKTRAIVGAPSNVSADEVHALGRKQTTALSSDQVNQSLGKAKPAAVKRKGLERFSSGRLSAAERARIRRESPGLPSTLKIFWLDASDALRSQVAAGGGVLLVGLIALVYYLALYQPDVGPKLPPEPTTLGHKKIRYSFGLGEGVNYPHRDDKMFEFEFSAATRALLIVYYQSQDISAGEVDVTVNGTSVEKLVADTDSSGEKMNYILLRPNLVKRGEKNTLVFDNVKNPPGYDTWRISNLWMETNLLPDMPPDQLVREARDAYQRGQIAFERRDVGADSRYRAYRAFFEAWLKLEAHPDPKPQLYQLARQRLRESQQELDRTCKKLMLEVEKYYHLRDYAAARQTLDFVSSYFPADDQPCPNLAEEKREEYGL